MIKATLAVLLAALPAAVSAAGDDAFSKSLSEGVGEPAAVAAPAGRRVASLYAEPVLQGAVKEHIAVFAMDAAGQRAVLKRIAPGFLFGTGDTVISVMSRDASGGWRERRALSRGNGKWIGGVTLSARAFSADGRQLIFSRLENTEDFHSGTLNVLDVDSGRSQSLGAWDKDSGAANYGKELAAAVAKSEWFQAAYPGRAFAEIFPDSKERCGAKGQLKAVIESRQTLVVSQGQESVSFNLKNLPGTSAWAFQSGDWQHAYSADCSRSLITVEEVLSSQGPSFFYGGNAYDAAMRVMEVGAR